MPSPCHDDVIDISSVSFSFSSRQKAAVASSTGKQYSMRSSSRVISRGVAKGGMLEKKRRSSCRRCIAPDFLGLGYTEVAKGQSAAPDAQVEMLTALLDTREIGQVDLVANDSGGAIAQWLLVRYPQRVRTLLLTHCDGEIDCPPPALQPVFELARKG